jgi:hypothetical protein
MLTNLQKQKLRGPFLYGGGTAEMRLPQNRPFSTSLGSRPRLRLLAMETKLGVGAARKGNRTANPIGIREELLWI